MWDNPNASPTRPKSLHVPWFQMSMIFDLRKKGKKKQIKLIHQKVDF